MQDALIVQSVSAPREHPARLVLLFHGVGSNAEDLRPLGEALATDIKNTWIVSVRSPLPSEFGGWQWFSVQGVTEGNRPERVAAAMPKFVETVRHWQRKLGIDATATTLIGFSQGAIMALEATQQPESIASRVISIAGRFAQAPQSRAPDSELHLLHGEDDRVMPVAFAADATEILRSLGARVTLDRFAGLGHGIDGRVAQRIVELLG